MFSLSIDSAHNAKNRLVSTMLTHAVFLVVMVTRETMFNP
jgi:hypothetical protein